MFVCLSLFLLLSFAVLTSYVLFQRHFLISVPSVADIIGIARRVDELELADLLDPAKEEVLRANTTPAQFRDAQRARARILFEQIRAMTFNSLVILLWAEREEKKLQRRVHLWLGSRVRFFKSGASIHNASDSDFSCDFELAGWPAD